jgi:hypothetical protein
LIVTEVLDLLNKINGCTFAGLDCLTEVKLKGGKKNPMQGRVQKLVKGNRVLLFTNKKSSGYTNMVRRRLEQEGKDPDTFMPGNLAWGVRITNSPIIAHNENYYLQTVFLKAGEVQYLLDGKPIAKEDIQGLMPSPEGSGRQGLEDDNKVVVRTYMFESIQHIRLFKEERPNEDGEADENRGYNEEGSEASGAVLETLA